MSSKRRSRRALSGAISLLEPNPHRRLPVAVCAPLALGSEQRAVQVEDLSMAKRPEASIRVGIGGWVFEPWRGTFYPEGLSQKRELEYAASKLTSIEINGTYYGSQSPASFARWRDETPDTFVFSLKGPRFATNRKSWPRPGSPIERFFSSGVMELKDKLGPINWQFMPTKKFDPEDFEAFLKLLPKRVDSRDVRHAVEVRHDSFKVPEFVELARAHGAAIVIADKEDAPLIADITAPFVYVRLQRTQRDRQGRLCAEGPRRLGQARSGAGRKAERRMISSLLRPRRKSKASARDVFVYMIGGHKVSNPAAAMAFMERLN